MSNPMDEELARRWAPTLNVHRDSLRRLAADRELQIVEHDIPRLAAEYSAGKHQNPAGGLNAAGRKHFGVKKGVTNYSSAGESDKKRWVRWALRFTKTPRPLKDDAGKPTRYALMFHAWGEPVPTSPEAVRAVHTKAQSRAKQLKMGEDAGEAADVNQPSGQTHDETWLYSSDNDFWDDVVNQVQDDAPRTGVMVALFPDHDIALDLALPGGEVPDELHVTLAYLGEVGAEISPQQEQAIITAVTSWASLQPPINAHTNGLGVFDADPKVTYANVDSPQLPAARQKLVEVLEAAGLAPLQNHGFTPHMTLIYDDARSQDVPSLHLHFTHVVVAFAGRRTLIPLTGTAARATASLTVQQRPQQPAPINTELVTAEALPDTDVKAFQVEINGRQLVAGPAQTVHIDRDGQPIQHLNARQKASLREPSVQEIADDPILWMRGRFVGSNEANRNGAYWSSGDLELSSTSVAHGPLNWLHEARHIIGSLSSADYVMAEQAKDGRTLNPHIVATAGIWKWIWPDEAFVVNQASELGQLWYSMECVAQEIACTGPHGCGAKASYANYNDGIACAHVLQRASTRQFIKPTFLGGAIIVPPTRPGWADADAAVMAVAAPLAEAAFEQAYAGVEAATTDTQVATSDWERLMAQLVRYTQP